MRLRVLEVIASLQPAGAEKVVLQLAAGLARDRFETAVVSLYDPCPGGLEPAFDACGVPLWHLGKRRGPSAPTYARLQRVVDDFQPDVLHSHGYVLRYMLHLPAPVRVHTVHNIAEREVGRFGRFVNRIAYRSGVAPVAVGSVVAKSFSDLYGFHPAAVITNGIDTGRYCRPEARQSWRAANGFEAEDVLIISVARLERQKNPVALAHAISGIPGARLLIVGQGPLADTLEGRDRVHLLGVRDDIPEILSAADVFALASDWEGLPLAVIEAMAAGLPVVACSVGGIPELVCEGETGFLVSPGDETALQIALDRLVRSPKLRHQMGAAGQARSRLFSAEAMVSAYERLFDDLCEKTNERYRSDEGAMETRS